MFASLLLFYLHLTLMRNWRPLVSTVTLQLAAVQPDLTSRQMTSLEVCVVCGRLLRKESSIACPTAWKCAERVSLVPAAVVAAAAAAGMA